MGDGNKGVMGWYGPGRAATSALVALVILAGLTALVLYLVYRPSKPRFSVASAAVYRLDNASSSSGAAAPNVLSTSMQFTLVCRNPSDRASVFYDRLVAYAVYRDQPITPPVPLPGPVLQDKGSTIALSPVLGGDNVPVSGDVVSALLTDRSYGVLGLRVVLAGRLRYKSGPFHSGWTGMYVRCDVLIGLKKVDGPVPLLGDPNCDVDT